MSQIWAKIECLINDRFKKKSKTEIENWDFIMVF